MKILHLDKKRALEEILQQVQNTIGKRIRKDS
jgi:hypothetical protein